MRFQTKNGVLIAQANGETLRIEPWGKDSLRVRATMLPGFSGKDWALTEVPEKTEAKAEQFAVDHLEIDGSMGKRTSASITNGKIRAVVNFAGVITFYKEEQEKSHVYTIGGLELNEETVEVTVDGEAVKLTPMEFKIVQLLIKNPGRVFSADEIYERIWNEKAVNTDTIMVHVRNIREKIEIDPRNPKYLKVVWGVGYKIDKQ